MFKLIELTQPLSTSAPTWDRSCGFCLRIKKDYSQVFCVQELQIQAGIGTHMDAPSHRFEGAPSIGDIPIEQLVVPICLINVSAKATETYEISIEDVEQYEKAHGTIAPNSLVIGYTGWSRFWPDSIAYRNADKSGQMHFPAFAEKAAELLITRRIAGIAIDTLSPDCSASSFPVHRLILGAGKYIIENIGNCSKLPPKGAFAIALPLYAPEATESPIRIIGLLPSGE